MKHIFLPLLFFILFSCKKESEMAATHPEYSFIRLNEEGFVLPDCSANISKCLPAAYLDDLKFQLITDFRTLNAPNRQFIVAFPCQDSDDNAENVYNDIFSGAQHDVTSVGSDGDGSQTGIVGAMSIITTLSLSVGDLVYFSIDETGGTNVDGFAKVILISGIIKYTDKSVSGGIPTWNPGDFKVQKIPDTYIMGLQSFPIANDSEFSGTNNAWNLSTNSGVTLPYEIGDCFRLCVWRLHVQDAVRGGQPTFDNGEFLGSTNCFEMVLPSCYNSKVLYGCNEDAFGFYGDGWTNTIRLPIYLSRGNYDGEEKGYQKSNGQFKKLAERVNKTYELRTDDMPEEWHDRLRVALSCDTIKVTNENINAVEMSVYKKEEYEVEWDEDRNYPFAQATAKVFKGLFRKSVNSNCA